MRKVLAGLVLIGLAAAPTVAQERIARLSHDAIAAGDLARAERRLVAERRIYPNHAELLLNLAAVYASTGRPAQAMALYRDVLSQPEVLMDLSDTRTAGSHAVAETGLRRLTGAQTASR